MSQRTHLIGNGRNAASGQMARNKPLSVLTAAAVVLGMTAAAAGVVPRLDMPIARADEVTAAENNLRTGWDSNEPGLSPSAVAGGSFGELFSTPVNGQVYAQPVVAGSTVIVATENDWVYGLDAATGAVKWSLSLGTPWPASSENCFDLAPNVGVTGTPVYDASTGTVYLVAKVVPPGNSDYQPAFYMHALNAQTGAELPGWPVQIQGAPVNDPTRPFNPFTSMERPALLELGGSVYAAFGSLCDITPYDGYVVGVNTSSQAVTMWTDESGVTDNMAGIWQSGGGLMSDGPGRIFFTSGNGVSPAPGPGSAPPPELAESVVRLGVQSGGSLAANDFFSPANAPTLDANDRDFGAGAPVGLPFGSSTFPDLIAQAGKDGRVFLLNRDTLGGREQGSGGTDAVVSQNGPFAGEWGRPAAFGDTTTVTASNSGSASDFVYYVGRNDFLRALQFGLNSSGTPVLTDVANSANSFGYSSGSPVVTSNGTDPASAVVWEIYSNDSTGAGGTLEAFDAVPASTCTASSPCTMNEIWSAPIGTATKFSVPATDSGRVYVGTRGGTVLGFGSPDSAPLSGASPANFGQVAVGTTSAAQDITVTANTAVTVNGVTATSASSPDPFSTGSVTVNGSPATLPVSLNAGDTMTVPVTFAPTTPGGATGSLAFATDSANFPTVNVSLSGDGTQTGLYATPASVSFGTVTDGTSQSAIVDVINGGTTSETVSSVSPPSAPFSATGLPSGTIAPGASVAVTVTYKPTAAENDASSFTINDADGTSLRVDLSGTGATAVSQLSPSPATISFGSVPLGQQVSQTIDLTNTGNLTATVSGTSIPTVPFGAPDHVATGLPVNPGYDLKIPITFSPTSVGQVTSAYKLTWSDVLGKHTVTVPVSGTGTAPSSGIAVPPPGGGWTLNGGAHMSGTSLSLTPVTTNVAGSAVYAVPEPSNGLQASFTAQIGGGTGGDGMTLALLNASKAKTTALGGSGALLGFGGLPGIAVTLDTEQDGNYPSANFVGVATGASNGQLVFAATSSNVPDLRSGPVQVGVAVSGQQVTVTVNGNSVLSSTLPAGTVPPSVLLAFTGATSSLTDNHMATSATFTAGGNPLPPPGGGWSYNGTADMSRSDTVLTKAVTNEAGSVVYPTPVTTNGLQVVFNAQLSGGTGGNGLTFALLNPAQATDTALGGDGGELGFGGLPGIAVTLVTYKSTGYPSSNFAAISAGTSNGLLTFQTYVNGIPKLRSGTHTVMVQVVDGDVLIVWLDGEQILQYAEPGLTATSMLAFTAGTSSVYETHTVRNAAIAAAG